MKRMREDFYSQNRWQNWINKVKESNFKLTDSADKNAGAVFVYIMDDVVLACLKVISRNERGAIPEDKASAEINKIKDIVFQEQESFGDDADLMLESLKTSLAAVFVSCQRYITGDFDRQTPLGELVKKAVAAEQEENLDETFNILSQVGSRVISGESLVDLEDLPYSMTAELLDGIDAISAAMMGDDSYKEDDGTDEEGEDF
ncbi:MAG: DUF2150 family protein [Methanotrichaceae archaeon]|nr:DUF2150 family protein [Methanotrichaceae archaeon]